MNDNHNDSTVIAIINGVTVTPSILTALLGVTTRFKPENGGNNTSTLNQMLDAMAEEVPQLSRADAAKLLEDFLSFVLDNDPVIVERDDGTQAVSIAALHEDKD